MVKENLKRKKRHDKDKYYHLAKEQGFRSRAAFKLIQINRKYDFLSKAKVCLDLCAAPGGWCQVAARHMPSESVILGIDLLPIRPIRNVKTIVQDITTAECRALVKKELKNHTADVVLCDGAPNVGGNYEKDAFVQNEIALAALRVATQHLGPGGTFLTKVYRSQDYNALMWVFNQLFQSVQAIKPSSSRSQSAEIFVLCLKYRAPHSIDPRLLDPKAVFSELDDTGKASINIFSQQYEKQKRHRSGYDTTAGVLLFRKLTVSDFIDGEDPVQMLTDYNAIVFDEGCQPYLEHKQTTPEIKACMDDLKVLGKSDFKALLKWRLKMKEYRDALTKAAKKAAGEDDDDDDKDAGEEEAEAVPMTEAEEEDAIQKEIRELQDKARAKKKRERKKEREHMAKVRVRQALGMNHQAIELPEFENVFSLKAIRDVDGLEAVRGGDYAQLGPEDDEDEGVVLGGSDMEEEGSDSDSDVDAAAKRAKQLEEDLEASYHTYLSNRSDERMKGTKAGKRKKAAMTAIAGERIAEDAALYDGDLGAYVKLLSGKKEKKAGAEESDDSSSSEEEEEEERGGDSGDEEDGTDGESDEEEGEDDEEDIDDLLAPTDKSTPLVVDPSVFLKEKGKAKAARWFSNPLFQKLGADDDDAKDGEASGSDAEADDDADVDEAPAKKTRGKKGKKEEETKGKAAGRKRKPKGGGEDEEEEDGIPEMPKTDKQLRHEKRIKEQERRERKKNKRAKIGAGNDGNDGIDEDGALEALTDPVAAAALKKKRALIHAGMGSALDADADTGFEVVPADGSIALPPVMDDRKYDSENEQWDDEERAATLAIGTMMLRRSKAKALVDASYNRFAWNDANDLPEWFVDDEEKHYRPQVPIPKALMDEMKERFKSLASKPIKKVAEARARKKKREVMAVKRAKAKAAAVMANPDMTEKEKMAAVRKAVKAKGGELSRPGKVYAVAKRNGSASSSKKGGAKGGKVKLVDKRMKKDLRGMKNAVKKGKGPMKGAGKKKGGKGRK